MRKGQLELSFRSPRASDEAFIMRVGRRVFSRWSRDPGRSLASMMQSQGARVIVGEQRRKPVGFAILDLVRLRRSFGPWEAPAVARLDAIAVDPEKQGLGAGSLLLAEAEEVAQIEGAVVMTLMTACTNLTARSLFGGAGYHPLLDLDRSYANGDAAIEMFKPLA